jgi:hypothetical protein
MDKDTKAKLAALLRAAAGRAIPEDQFWKQFKAMVDPFTDPFAGDAFETATHYWGNFHERNLLLIRVKPDVYQLMQGQDALNLIAEALERDWPLEELKRRLDDI